MIHELFHRTYLPRERRDVRRVGRQLCRQRGRGRIFSRRLTVSRRPPRLRRAASSTAISSSRAFCSRSRRVCSTSITRQTCSKDRARQAARSRLRGDQGRLCRAGAFSIGARPVRPRQAAAEQRGADKLPALLSPARQLRRAQSDESRRLARDHRADNFDRQGASRRSFLRHRAGGTRGCPASCRTARPRARRQSLATAPLRGRRRNDRRPRRSRVAPSRRFSP